MNWTEAITNIPAVSSVVFGGGQYVASGSDGTFLTSSDGLSWANPQPVQTVAANFRDLKYLNSAFWGVPYYNHQLTVSADGTNWTNIVNLTNVENLLTITYGNGIYVAGGENGTVWVSTDGLNWTNPAPRMSTFPSADVAVAFGDGVFVGASGYAADILTSSDGTNWTVQQLQTNTSEYVSFRDVAFGNGRFVAVSENAVATSTDGTNWFFNTGAYNLKSVTTGNGRFVAVGYNTVAVSKDGTNWITQQSGAFGTLTSVAFGGSFYVATGPGTTIGLHRDESPLWISEDGLRWSKRSSGTPRGLFRVGFGNGTFVVGAEYGAILQSDPLVSLNMSVQSSAKLLLSGPINRAYRIEYTDTLNPNDSSSWVPLTTVSTTNSSTQLTDTSWTNSLRRFYRAELLP